MEDQQINQFISAFAAGCLDKENYANFKEYMLSGGELPERDLGELQNTIALIPTILEIEEPDPKIKGLVAKKLISLKDEIKEKIKEEKQRESIPKFLQNTKKNEEKKEAVQNVEPETVQKIELEKEADIFEEVEDVKIEIPIQHDATVKVKEKPLHKTDPKFKNTESIKPQRVKVKSSFMSKFLTFILFCAVLALGWFSWTLFNKNKELETKITDITEQLDAANKLIQEKNELPNFLNHPEITVVNLRSADKHAKLLIDFGTREALLYLTDFQPAPTGKAYQLWFKTKDADFSICIFEPSQRTKQIEIKDFPPANKADIKEFIITIEPIGGSVNAVGEIFMRGIF